MALMSFITKQFVDVIQWMEEGAGVLAFRYPMEGREIQNGATLVVREAQAAVFFDEGRFADRFQPGTYTLTTNTLPVLTYLENWDKGFESPFKSDVYFFSTREQIDRKWGTPQPITLRDPEFGPIRLRAFGSYSFAVEDVEIFWRKLVGTADRLTVADVEGQLKAAILTALASHLGKGEVAFLDLAASQQDLSATLGEAVRPVLADYGLALRSFFVQSLSLPEALQARLDKVAAMRMVGDLDRYAKFQAADAIEAAAANPGGVAGVGAGMAAGLAIGQAMMPGLGAGAAPPVEDPIALLERLAGLRDKGILSPQEFDAKKAELLARIK